MKNLIAVLAVIALCAAKHPQEKKLKPAKSVPLQMTEPSDICFSTSGTTLFVASGDRYIYEVDLNGKTIRKATHEGFDYESVYASGNYVYANDESLRKVDVYDAQTLNYIKSFPVHYNGPINKGFESLTWNEEKKCYVMVSEKSPCVLFEFNSEFQQISEIDIPAFREISALTYHNGNIWFLSDEEETVYKVNPSDYSIIDKWKVPIDNPEGIAFDKEGNLYISSDDMGRLFYFSNPQL